ncbi:MAG: hypothetical protein KDA24_14200 [Deltaproteobacteria bacterium]|nr:hypothetical protein [Deltaproteobacteria bacterium]
MRNRPLLPAFLLLAFLMMLALPAGAAEQPKVFMGTWLIEVPAEVQTQIEEAEEKAKASEGETGPEAEMAAAMLEMMMVLTTMEMEFSKDAIVMRAGGEEKERATWHASKNTDGTYVLTVVETDGKDSPATATITGDRLTIQEGDGEALVFIKQSGAKKPSGETKKQTKQTKKSKKGSPAKTMAPESGSSDKGSTGGM